MEVKRHVLPTSALEGGEWAVHAPVSSFPKERTRSSNWTRRFVVARAGLDAVVPKRNITPCRESNFGHPALLSYANNLSADQEIHSP
jgi:hypothetical protein